MNTDAMLAKKILRNLCTPIKSYNARSAAPMMSERNCRPLVCEGLKTRDPQAAAHAAAALAVPATDEVTVVHGK
jgi:hypothetical protein